MRSFRPDIMRTGNEFVSLPEILTENCGIMSVGFVSESLRGCVEMRGSAEMALIEPIVMLGTENILRGNNTPALMDYWVPSIQNSDSTLSANCTIAAMPGRSGFVVQLQLANLSEEALSCRVGWRGRWSESVLSAGQTRKMNAHKSVSDLSKESANVVLEFVGCTPMHALSLLSPECVDVELSASGSFPGSPDSYVMLTDVALKPGEKRSFSLYVGIGVSQVSAVAASKEQCLQGAEKVIDATRNWLQEHTIKCFSAEVEHVLNRNSFYNFFYTLATSLDTEGFMMLASRDTSQARCGVYRELDSMRWSLPSVLQMSWSSTRSMLLCTLTKHLKNIGVHTKNIDGTVMEPGLQLDQICAPIRALDTYLDRTGDLSLLFDMRVQQAINRVQQILAGLRSSDVPLFESLWSPSGSYSKLPYLCYSNALVCRVYEDLAVLYGRIRDTDLSTESSVLAEQIRQSILDNFVVEGPFGPMFAYSVDLQGNYELHDEVEGSLVLLAYLNFCKPTDPIYLNTLEWIRSEHNPNVGLQNRSWRGDNDRGYSVIGAINEMLVDGSEDLAVQLCAASMENGIAYSRIDRESGVALTSADDPFCAGYLAFGLQKAMNASVPSTAVLEQKSNKKLNEALYHPPPKSNINTKKARL